ncbi:response regulator transcription factor [Candidatus Saccharibacteria bacterium]|nr:response regulator transcription factor [Candidatus Saccharibacteria bacterium]
MSTQNYKKPAVKIAVIEDDQPIREMYAMKLRTSGFEVAVAEDGQQGLSLAKKFLPDLILLDLRMPIMDGTEMLKQLRAENWGQKILVIILTNISPDETPMDLRLLKVEKYIVKAHYTPRQVLDEVMAVLRRYGKI